MSKFTHCLQRSQALFIEHIHPILSETFPALKYDAGLIGTGSEILGYDDEQSTDHDYRPRTYIFLSTLDANAVGKDVEKILRQKLPKTFQGYSTMTDISDDPRSRCVHSLAEYMEGYFGMDITHGLQPNQWLLLPEQKLLSFTSGAVFHSARGTLQAYRDELSYYPEQVWLYRMACQWQRIGQEEHFMGRAGSRGDELGSHIIATRLVHDIMKLAFLQERKYAPYIKWFGTAFAELDVAPRLSPILQSVMSATQWIERERYLSKAYETVAEKHNTLSVTPSMPTTVSSFHGRPFLVIHAENFATALQKKITEPLLRTLPLIGAVDQMSDNTDVLENAEVTKKAKSFYE